MHVDDVVVAGSELAPERDRPLREGGEVGDGAVRPVTDGPPEGNEVVGSLPELGLGTVEAAAEDTRRIPRGEHSNVLSLGYELLRQRLDMPVHASLVRPGIGRDKRNAHRARVPRRLAVLRVGSHTSVTYPASACLLRGELLISPACDQANAKNAPKSERAEHEKGRPRIVDEHAHSDRHASAEQAGTCNRGVPEPGVDPAPLRDRRANPHHDDPEQGVSGRLPEVVRGEPQPPFGEVGEVPGPAGVEDRTCQVGVAA